MFGRVGQAGDSASISRLQDADIAPLGGAQARHQSMIDRYRIAWPSPGSAAFHTLC